MIEKKKTPKDYPAYFFRFHSETEKQEVIKQIERIVDGQNKSRAKDEKMVRANTVVIEALRIGLKQLEKRLTK